MTNGEVLRQVEQGYRMPCTASCPKELYNIMIDCWQRNPDDRPSFDAIQWKLEEFFTSDRLQYDGDSSTG
ncbi:hypothetical protein GJ496_006764 [Pomphorhynchus laevis]|nr:hypothetical protein GJ496_006764 [Pomphorhynchus laevis]